MSLSPEERDEIRKVVAPDFFMPRDVAIWIAAKNYAYEQAAKVCDPVRAHTYASENADRYRTQDEWGDHLAKRIRLLKDKHG